MIKRNVVPNTLPPVGSAYRHQRAKPSSKHLPTPETATTTRYFVVHGRDFAQQDKAMTKFMHDQLFVAFHEDVTGLALQEEVLARTPIDELYEVSVGADGPRSIEP